MKQLEQLMKEANPLKSYAIELENFITKVDGDIVIFSEKQSAVTTMKNAVQEMHQVAELLDGLRDTVIVSRGDAAVLSFMKSNFEKYCKQNDQLSEVLGELVQMLDLNGTGIDIFILHYVSDAMESLRALLGEIKDIEYSK